MPLKKLTLIEIKERLKIVNPNIKILSKKYISSATRLKCKCLIDGHIWESFLGNLSKGVGCPKCNGNLKLTLEEIKNKLKIINPNIEILSNRYVNAHLKLECKCKLDGYTFDMNWNKLSQKRGCPKCGGTTKLILPNLILELFTINPNIEILSTKYVNSATKLKCRCKIDGYIWESKYGHLKGKHGCPLCAIATISGENSYRWKGGVTPLHEYLRMKITAWKKDSIKSCGFKCIITGKSFDVIHHRIGFDQILKETIETINLPLYHEINKYTDIELKLIENTCLELHYKYGLGVCLAKEVHMEFHNIYGNGNNTNKQFEEFKQQQLNKDKIEAS